MALSDGDGVTEIVYVTGALGVFCRRISSFVENSGLFYFTFFSSSFCFSKFCFFFLIIFICTFI